MKLHSSPILVRIYPLYKRRIVYLFIAIRLKKRYDARYLEMFFMIIFFQFNHLFFAHEKSLHPSLHHYKTVGCL